MLTTKRPQRAASSIFVAALIATACGDPTERPGAPTGDTARADLRIVAVTHGVSADPFWSVVINGLDDAARDLGLRVEYQAPNTFDMVAMSEIIDAAVASRPDGLVVSVPDPDAVTMSLNGLRSNLRAESLLPHHLPYYLTPERHRQLSSAMGVPSSVNSTRAETTVSRK